MPAPEPNNPGFAGSAGAVTDNPKANKLVKSPFMVLLKHTRDEVIIMGLSLTARDIEGHRSRKQA
jgi:hypothetical protein